MSAFTPKPTAPTSDNIAVTIGGETKTLTEVLADLAQGGGGGLPNAGVLPAVPSIIVGEVSGLTRASEIPAASFEISTMPFEGEGVTVTTGAYETVGEMIDAFPSLPNAEGITLTLDDQGRVVISCYNGSAFVGLAGSEDILPAIGIWPSTFGSAPAPAVAVDTTDAAVRLTVQNYELEINNVRTQSEFNNLVLEKVRSDYMFERRDSDVPYSATFGAAGIVVGETLTFTYGEYLGGVLSTGTFTVNSEDVPVYTLNNMFVSSGLTSSFFQSGGKLCFQPARSPRENNSDIRSADYFTLSGPVAAKIWGADVTLTTAPIIGYAEHVAFGEGQGDLQGERLMTVIEDLRARIAALENA